MKIKAFLLTSVIPAAFTGASAYAQTTTGIAAGSDTQVSEAEVQAESSVGIADIVVTAQKREQNLQDVPVSISALGQESIVVNRIQNVSDLSRISPNLTVREGAGGSRAPQFILRGIYTFGTAAGTDKGVSLYLDGVYIQNVAGSIFDFADIERIEVLRGPQGTLFGRNATGGAISVITRAPTGAFGVRQDVSVGNLGQLRSKTRVDLPTIGPFSITASYLHSERKGEVRNLGAGTMWDYGPATGGRLGQFTSPKRLGGENNEGVFVAVEIDLHPDLDLSYKFDYSESDYTQPAVGLSNYLPGAAAAAFGGFAPPAGTEPNGSSVVAFATVQALYNAQNPALRTPLSKKRPRAVNNEFTMPGRAEGYGHNFTAQWYATDSLTFKNILSYRDSKLLSPGFQLDGMGGLRVPAGPLGLVPFALVVNNAGNDQKQFSNEFQINYDSDLLTLTVGAIHFEDDQKTGGFDNTYNVIQFTPIIGQNTTSAGRSFVLPQNTGFELFRVKTKSDAIFAQPEFHVAEGLDLVGGIRVTRDKKDGFETLPGATPGPVTTAQQQAATGVAGAVTRYRDTRVTYLVGVNYKPNDDILLYAKYVTGYISGGQIATIQFDPETSKSAELGVKADLFDRRLRSNLSLFHVKYGSIQQATLGALTGIASSAPFAQAIIPSADARAYGFEWENTLAPVAGLVLQANIGYVDFDYQGNLFPGFVFTAGAPGVQEFQRPKWTVDLSGSYETPEVFAGGHFAIRADASFKSRTLLSNDISPGNGPMAREDPAVTDASTIPPSWTVNGRIAFEEFDLGGAKGTIALFGKNIFNNRNILQATNFGFSVPVLYERARTYGLDLTVEF